jgi:hypothetical protein
MIEYIIENLDLPQYSPNTNIIENTRNRLHYHDTRFYYYGNGYFGLSEWHKYEHQLSFLDNYFHIPLKATHIMLALHEANNRYDYVLDKHNHGTRKHFWNLITGFIIEYHMKDWFVMEFPEYYQSPDNSNDYTQASLDDWVINLNGELIRFDAKKHNGVSYIEAYRTKQMRIFVLGNIVDDEIIVYGFVTSKYLKRYAPIIRRAWADGTIKEYYRIYSEYLYPFKQLRAYLNCLKMDIEFEYHKIA